MSDANTINTKVELVVESVEDLCNAIIDGRGTDRTNKAARDAATRDILEKREALREHLRDFLAPRVRLIQGGKGVQPYAVGVTDADKPKCLKCLRTTPCPLGKGTQCDGWADAVRRKRAEVLPDVTDGDVA